MAFTDAQKVDIRRYCGYPAYGGEPVQAFGHRFYQWYGTLEFRMNNLSDAEQAVVLTYLAQLATLDLAIVSAGDNLDTDVAAVWTHNKNEVRDRMRLYRARRQLLCDFFGIPPGPNMSGGGSSVELVV